MVHGRFQLGSDLRCRLPASLQVRERHRLTDRQREFSRPWNPCSLRPRAMRAVEIARYDRYWRSRDQVAYAALKATDLAGCRSRPFGEEQEHVAVLSQQIATGRQGLPHAPLALKRQRIHEQAAERAGRRALEKIIRRRRRKRVVQLRDRQSRQQAKRVEMARVIGHDDEG